MKKFKNAFTKNPLRWNFKTIMVFFLGLVALIWFLVRVIPKPSRAAYPCQQAAFPLASAFVIWLTGILSSSFLFVKAKIKWRRSQYAFGLILFFVAMSIFLVTSTSLKYSPAVANAYIFTNNLLGNPMPGLVDLTDGKDCVVEPVAYVSSVKSTQANAEDIEYEEIAAMVATAIEDAGGLEDIISDGDTVLLKPNLVVSVDGTASAQQLSPEVNGVTTDYRVVQAVVDQVNEINPNGVIYIVEGSASGSTSNNMSILMYDQITGIDSLICLEDACGDWGDTASVYLQRVSLPPEKVLYDGADNRYWLYKLYYEADVVISLPVLKNHVYAGTTGGVKNVGIGATPPTIYANYPDILRWKIDHLNPPRTNLHYWIHDYYMCRPVDFVLMDGLQSVQNGPVSSTSTDSLSQDQMNMRLILASKDPVAVDAIGSLLTHHDPELIPHLVTLHNDSLGCSDARLIRVVGAKVGDEKKDFEISDTGELSKHSDFEAPDFTIDECYVSGPQLHFSLDVSADVTKVEVMIDSVYLDQIVICGFDNFNLNLDTIEINEESEITVFAYDQYLNYSSQVVSPVTKVPENKVSQGSIFLISISPNPFKSILTFTYRLNNSSEVIISIYDSQGNLVNEIVREQADGTHNVKWNAAGLPAGTYYCRIRAGEDICVSKIVRLK